MATLITKALDSIKSKNDDDFVDKLNYVWTARLFGFFAFIILMKQFFGDSIGCFLPPEFTGSWRKYTIDYCFARNTYFVEMEERFPPREERFARELHYYQYVPFILAAQLFMFLLPKMLCKSMNSKTGLVLNKVTAHDSSKQKDIEEKGEKLLKTLLSRYHGMPKRNLDTTAQFTAFLRKTSITRTYLLFKFLNTLNAMIQLYLINKFMAPKTTTTGTGLWGYDFVHDWMDAHSWRRTGHFPRVTFCDVWIREIAAEPIVYTVQCVLMVNLLNEKIFIVVWFWLLMMSALNAFNLVHWIFNTQVDSRKFNFIKNKLHLEKRDKNAKHIEEFVFKFLLSDGVTSLRLVEINSGELASSIMTQLIWQKFLIKRGYEKEEKKKLPEIVPNADTLKVVNEVTSHFKLT